MHADCIKRILKKAKDLLLEPEDLKDIERTASQAWLEFSNDEHFKGAPSDEKVRHLSRRAKELHLQEAFSLADNLEAVGRAKGGEQLKTFIGTLRGESTRSLEGAIAGRKSDYRRHFAKFHNFGEKYLGFANDPDVQNKTLLAFRGVETDNQLANEFAQTFRKLNKQAVEEARSVGVEFSPLENWGSPQPDDPIKISATKRIDYVEKVYQWIDKGAYEAKGLSGEEGLKGFLAEIYETKASEGRNKVIESRGAFEARGIKVGGSRRQPRHLHLTPEGYVAYMREFGGDISADTLIKRTLDPLARDTEVARIYGSRANENFNWVLAQVAENDRKKLGVQKIKDLEKEARTYWERLTVSREILPQDMTRFQRQGKRVGDALTTWQVAKSFGMQVFSTIPEMVKTVSLGTHRTGMSMRIMFDEIKKSLSSSNYRAYVNSIAPSFEHAISAMMEEGLGGSFHSGLKVIANKAVAWQGLQIMDRFHTNFLSASLMNYMGEITRDFQSFNGLKKRFGNQTYKTFVNDYGFTATDFKILSMVERERGIHLTSDSIRSLDHPHLEALAKSEGKSVERLKNDLASKYNTMIWSQVQEHARGSMHSSLQDTKWTSSRGGNPILRFATQFLVTPFSIARQHLITVPKHLEGGSKGTSAQIYRAKFLAFGIFLEGLVANIAKGAVQGSEQPDYTDGEVLAGIFARTLFHYDRFYNEYHNDLASLIKGVPVAASVIDLGDAVLKRMQADSFDERKKERLNAALARQVLSNIPLKNLFYIKAAFQHLVMENICEMLNPGYKERLEERRKRKQTRSNFK